MEKWSDVEGLWDHVFNGLMVIPEHPDFSVLVSQSALSPKKNTEKIAEVRLQLCDIHLVLIYFIRIEHKQVLCCSLKIKLLPRSHDLFYFV